MEHSGIMLIIMDGELIHTINGLVTCLKCLKFSWLLYPLKL